MGVALRASGGQIRHFVIKFSLILREFERLHVMMRLRQRLLALQDIQRHPRLEGDGVVASQPFHRYAKMKVWLSAGLLSD